MKRLLALGSLVTLFILVAPSCVSPSPAAPANNTPLSTDNQSTATPVVVLDKPGVGDPAPDLQLTDMTGKTVTLADYKGQIVWLNFWASW